jgi:SOS response regulatory protein OraA/RecX
MKELSEEIGNTIVLREFNAKEEYVTLNFGDFKIKILPETYEEFKFSIGKEYKKETILECIAENKKNEIVRYGISKFAKKNYCSNEIKKKINKKFSDYPSKIIDEAIEILKLNNFIDDKFYVEQYLEYFNVGCYGKYYIINFFNSQKIDNKLIDQIEFNDEVEKEKANRYFELIKNKYVSNNFIKQKKKIYDNLLRRGFDVSLISELIDTLEIDEAREEKALIKSYLKEKNKMLSEKNHDEAITNKIISKLVSKGYSYEKIKDIIKKDEEGELKDD